MDNNGLTDDDVFICENGSNVDLKLYIKDLRAELKDYKTSLTGVCAQLANANERTARLEADLSWAKSSLTALSNILAACGFELYDNGDGRIGLKGRHTIYLPPKQEGE